MMRNTVSFLVGVLYKSFVVYASNRLESLGLSLGQVFFLIYIGKHPGCSQSELTKALKVDWGHSQRSITRLVNEEFINKQKSTLNSKVYQLTLTEKGQRAFELSHQMFYDWDEHLLEKLSVDERQELSELLAKASLGNGEIILSLSDKKLF